MPQIMKPNIWQPCFLQETLEGRHHIIRGEMLPQLRAKHVIVMLPILPSITDLLCLLLFVGDERLEHNLWQCQTSASALRFWLRFNETGFTIFPQADRDMGKDPPHL